MIEPSGTVRELTPHGRGAVAALRLEADLGALVTAASDHSELLFAAANRKPLSELPLNRICFGRWGQEELVVVRTEEQVVEIYPHGGVAAVGRIQNSLEQLGVKTSPDDSDALDTSSTILSCLTERTASFVLEQQAISGPFWERCRDKELSDEEITSARCWENFGRHLTEPWEIVFAGAPNVGKSSLMNLLLGFERCIVYDQPGTTRDVLSSETALDGWPVRFSDTAGQRQTSAPLEAAGIEAAKREMSKADLVVILFDRDAEPDETTLELYRQFPEAILVDHKADLEAHPAWKASGMLDRALSVSSKTGSGTNALLDRMIKKLVPSLPEPGTIFPIDEDQRALLENID